MKKIAWIIAALLLMFAACAKEQETPAPQEPTQAQETEKAPATEEPEAEAGNPEKFSGAYVQEDADPEATYMTAEITDDAITITWSMDGGETTALYWAGTFEQPQGPGEYVFDSINDTEKTQYALLASNDATKTMTVKDGKISFSVTMMGVTRTIYLIPTETTP